MAFTTHLSAGGCRRWVWRCTNAITSPARSWRRSTHRVAIPNDRLLGIDDGKVQFRWKDYRDNSRHKTMTLVAEEFIRRFLLHVLPEGFQRIRHYGFLANRYRA